jgi:hypothetical protein
MKKATIGAIAGWLLGDLVGFLWWGVPRQHVQEEVQTVEREQTAAEELRLEKASPTTERQGLRTAAPGRPAARGSSPAGRPEPPSRSR